MVSFILALADNGVFGKRGTLMPWRLSADMIRFKSITMGHPIIMGRKTYETFQKPLPGRTNIVVTRNADYQAEGCIVVQSLEAAIEAAKASEGADEIFIIGGSELFNQAVPQAGTIYLTRVHAEPDGDVFFDYKQDEWHEVSSESHPADNKNQYPYSFVTLKRN